MAMSFLVTVMFLVNCVTKPEAFQHQHGHKPSCYYDPQSKRAVGEPILARHHMKTLR